MLILFNPAIEDDLRRHQNLKKNKIDKCAYAKIDKSCQVCESTSMVAKRPASLFIQDSQDEDTAEIGAMIAQIDDLCPFFRVRIDNQTK